MKHLWQFACVVSIVLLSACQAEEQGKGLLRVGLAQMPITLDPRYATDAASARVQKFVHRGLLKLDEHFNVQSDLAIRWENPEPLIWRFYLQQGVYFSDGSSVNAADVVATLDAVLDARLASPLKAGFEAIDSVNAIADNVVEIRLSKPDASLLTRLNLGILPESIAGLPHKAHFTIGCGPFQLHSWTESALTLHRVAEANKFKKSQVSVLRFLGVKDPVTRILKLTRSELDFVQNDLPPHLLSYMKEAKLNIQTRPSTTFSYIGLNLQDDILKDVRVRRALALGLDRARLKKALFADLPELAESVLTPMHWASFELPSLGFDHKEAMRLLDEAGFPRDSDGVRFTMNFRTSTDPTRLRLATAIAAMWQDIGVKVSIESLEWGGFYARIKRGDFQVFSLAWVGITDPDIYRWILHSDMWPPKGANRGRYSNAQMDVWLDEAAAAGIQSKRKALYALIEQKMQLDMVYIPLWYDPIIAVSGPRISGFKAKPDGGLESLMDVELLD